MVYHQKHIKIKKNQQQQTNRKNIIMTNELIRIVIWSKNSFNNHHTNTYTIKIQVTVHINDGQYTWIVSISHGLYNWIKDV